MSTPGYDPLQTLWHLFQADDAISAKIPISKQQREKIEQIIRDVTAHLSPGSPARLQPDGTSLVGRFLKAMADANGKTLTAQQADLADGLLECVNRNQPGEPWARPHDLRTGIWDHFKGGVYKVRGFSRWASGDGEKVVEYTSLLHGTDHTRLADQWCEVVQWPDKKYRSRFVYRGEDLKTPEPAYKVSSSSPKL